MLQGSLFKYMFEQTCKKDSDLTSSKAYEYILYKNIQENTSMHA